MRARRAGAGLARGSRGGPVSSTGRAAPEPAKPLREPERSRAPKLFVVEKWNAFWDPADFTLKAQAAFSVRDASLGRLSELLLSLQRHLCIAVFKT